MKKHLQTLLILSASIGIFSCSKKVTTFNFGKPYYENKTEVVTTKQPTLDETTEIVTASTENKIETESPKIVLEKSETVVAAPSFKKSDNQKAKFKEAKKQLKMKIKEVQKGGGMSDNMKLGIIIAAISLVVLIVVAAGLLGGLSNLFWLLGGLGLLTGLIIILLAALDVI